MLTLYLYEVSSKLPMLALETVVGYLFKDVVCDRTHIELHSTSVSSLRELSEQILMTEELLVITSHHGCNDNGGRDAYV